MKFGSVPVEEAVGAVSVHAVQAGPLRIRKGSLLTAESVAALRQAGVDSVVAARLEPGDVGEDEAAHKLAFAVAGSGIRVEPPFTGRANLFAREPGLLRLAPERIGAINAVDEALTLATLPAFKPVVAGEMVATVKIIPYAAPALALQSALATAASSPISIAPWRLRQVGVVSTLLPGLKPTTVAKTLSALGDRLAPAGAVISSAAESPHDTAALTARLRDAAAGRAELIVVFGASAIADRRDVIPAAIEAAGGAVEHFGMPVDPGNLLLVGRLDGKPVIGAPGCARSPKENGFDWVLHRLLAGIPVTRADITALGVGGLLMEIVSRGQPRAGGHSDGEAE